MPDKNKDGYSLDELIQCIMNLEESSLFRDASGQVSFQFCVWTIFYQHGGICICWKTS